VTVSQVEWFGLQVCANVPLPGPDARPGSVPDVRVHVSTTVADVPPRPVGWTAGPGWFSLNWPGKVQAHVEDGREIRVARVTDFDDIRCGRLVSHSLMSAVLHQRDMLPLHGSAVVVGGDRAVAFLGDSRAGKTEVALAVAASGGTLIADDVCAVGVGTGRPVVVAGSNLVAAWPDTWGRWPGWFTHAADPCGKVLSASDVPESLRSVPLAAILVLAIGNTSDVQCEPMQGVSALRRVRHHLHHLSAVRPMGLEVSHLAQLSSCVAQVPVWRLRHPGRQDMAAAVCEQVVTWVERQV